MHKIIKQLKSELVCLMRAVSKIIGFLIFLFNGSKVIER